MGIKTKTIDNKVIHINGCLYEINVLDYIKRKGHSLKPFRNLVDDIFNNSIKTTIQRTF